MRERGLEMGRSAARAAARLAIATAVVLCQACGGVQSALDPAGADAERIASIFTVMTVAFAIIWAGVVALAIYAPRSKALQSPRGSRWLIGGGGVALPVTVLATLIVGGLSQLPRLLALAPEGGTSVHVTGVQWWWRVRYRVPGREPVELANEIRLPVNERVNLILDSADVVHSFWVPPLAGKMDLIPGRTNRLALEPTRTGSFRGACAEFCGASHALMNLIVVVEERAAFDAWLASQAAPAAPPAGEQAQLGARAFATRGCLTCHRVRGTDAAGISGPDLTHVGSRETIAAGTLPATREQFERWITGTERLKPGVHMPAFAQLPREEVAALAAYLDGLQ